MVSYDNSKTLGYLTTDSRYRPGMTSYQQPSKEHVRERLIHRAVECLTTDRNKSCIVQNDELEATVGWFTRQLKQIDFHDGTLASIEQEFKRWTAFSAATVGSKDARSLKVLYLCGPEPLNDLTVLMNCGVDPLNVWALTSSKEDYDAALKEVSQDRLPLKVHRGSLAEFFEQFNETFDIIYFDACGAFCDGKPNTLSPVVNIFQHERLRSPGVLLTTFKQTPFTEGKSQDNHLNRVSAYFSSRYRDLPQFAHRDGPDPEHSKFEPEMFRQYVKSCLNELYPEFITRFIVDIGMNIIPSWRAFSMGAFSDAHLPSKAAITSARLAADAPGDFPDKLPGSILLSPGSYPLVSFFRELKKSSPKDCVLTHLAQVRDKRQRSMADNLEIASLLSNVIEGHWDLLNESMLAAISTPWFDRNLGISCDAPLPNLTINSLLGIYGRPWFVNPRACERFTYTAKVQRMHADLFVLDQCRPYFDWFPVLDAVQTRFESIPFQVVARCIMDRIGRHHFTIDSHPFRGASVLSWGEIPSAGWYDLPDRQLVE